MMKNVILSDEEVDKSLAKENTGSKYSRSQLISKKLKENNYVASKFIYVEDYKLYKFCQNVSCTGNLDFGAERYSPNYEEY